MKLIRVRLLKFTTSALMGFTLTTSLTSFAQNMNPGDIYDPVTNKEGSISSIGTFDMKGAEQFVQQSAFLVDNVLRNKGYESQKEMKRILVNTAKKVVTSSADMPTEPLMRIVLNRALKATAIIEALADAHDPWILDQQVRIMQRSSELAIRYIQNDRLMARNLIAGLKTSVKVPRALFGIEYSRWVFKLVESMVDATVRYRLAQEAIMWLADDINADPDKAAYAATLMTLCTGLENFYGSPICTSTVTPGLSAINEAKKFDPHLDLPIDGQLKSRIGLSDADALRGLRRLRRVYWDATHDRNGNDVFSPQAIQQLYNELQNDVKKQLGEATTPHAGNIFPASTTKVLSAQGGPLFFPGDVVVAAVRLPDPTSGKTLSVNCSGTVRELKSGGVIVFSNFCNSDGRLLGRLGEKAWNIESLFTVSKPICHEGLCTGAKVRNITLNRLATVAGFNYDGLVNLDMTLSLESKGDRSFIYSANWDRTVLQLVN